MITEKHIISAQEEWGKGVVFLGKRKIIANEFVKKMYARDV